MSEVRESTFTFRPREAPDAAEHVREALAAGRRGSTSCVDIDAPLDVVADAVPSGLGALSALGDRCEMRFSAWDVRSAAARLAWLPWEFRIVSPDGLADEVAALAGRLAASARPARLRR